MAEQKKRFTSQEINPIVNRIVRKRLPLYCCNHPQPQLVKGPDNRRLKVN